MKPALLLLVATALSSGLLPMLTLHRLERRAIKARNPNLCYVISCRCLLMSILVFWTLLWGAVALCVLLSLYMLLTFLAWSGIQLLQKMRALHCVISEPSGQSPSEPIQSLHQGEWAKGC